MVAFGAMWHYGNVFFSGLKPFPDELGMSISLMSPNQMCIWSTNSTEQAKKKREIWGLITICLFVSRSWDLSAWQLSISELATNYTTMTETASETKMPEMTKSTSQPLIWKTVLLDASEFWLNQTTRIHPIWPVARLENQYCRSIDPTENALTRSPLLA